jgi:hypothetical protein
VCPVAPPPLARSGSISQSEQGHADSRAATHITGQVYRGSFGSDDLLPNGPWRLRPDPGGQRGPPAGASGHGILATLCDWAPDRPRGGSRRELDGSPEHVTPAHQVNHETHRVRRRRVIKSRALVDEVQPPHGADYANAVRPGRTVQSGLARRDTQREPAAGLTVTHSRQPVAGAIPTARQGSTEGAVQWHTTGNR